jgi:hypothetical protein
VLEARKRKRKKKFMEKEIFKTKKSNEVTVGDNCPTEPRK